MPDSSRPWWARRLGWLIAALVLVGLAVAGWLTRAQPVAVFTVSAQPLVRKTEFDGDTVLTFAGGQAVSMRAEQGGLLLAVTVPEDADLDSFAQVVEEHLQRFGRRDELRVDWD